MGVTAGDRVLIPQVRCRFFFFFFGILSLQAGPSDGYTRVGGDEWHRGIGRQDSWIGMPALVCSDMKEPQLLVYLIRPLQDCQTRVAWDLRMVKRLQVW